MASDQIRTHPLGAMPEKSSLKVEPPDGCELIPLEQLATITLPADAVVTNDGTTWRASNLRGKKVHMLALVAVRNGNACYASGQLKAA